METRLQRKRYDSAGPNAIWHMKGYNKLKPYGISIQGCIDRFSRHVIWLKAGAMNKNPKVIAGNYKFYSLFNCYYSRICLLQIVRACAAMRKS